MRRRYDTAFFGNLIAKIKDAMPNAGIGIDVITGFPGETDEDFASALEFLSSLDFTYLHVFSYSERVEALSKNLVGKVSAAKVKDRTLDLRALSDEKRDAFYRSQIGETMRVIPETIDKSTGLRKAWTDNYIHVAYKSGNISNNFQYVQLHELQNDYVLSSVAIEK